MPDDEIRLTVPADEDLVHVVVAAVAAAVRQTGLGPTEVAHARELAADAFARQLDGGSGPVTVSIKSSPGEYDIVFERDGHDVGPLQR
jgi:hypothetical protein